MLPAKPFYLIRHGESEANAAQLAVGGGIDSQLTEKGINQAKTLAPYMDTLEIKPAVVHHSTMSRAKDTAHILNEPLNLKTHEWYNLREHEIGDWENQPWDIVHPLLADKVLPPNGETYSVFAQRIQSVFTDILNQSDDLPMIVCHGGVFHALGLIYEYGISPIQNCHLHYFEPENLFDQFPWRVTQFDIERNKLVQNSAPFCLSQALEHIA